MGVITGSIYAVMNGVKGYAVGLIVGAVVQAVSGLPHMALMFATGWAVLATVSGYWWGSTRLRERRSGVSQNSEITVYFADKLQVLDLRRK